MNEKARINILAKVKKAVESFSKENQLDLRAKRFESKIADVVTNLGEFTAMLSSIGVYITHIIDVPSAGGSLSYAVRVVRASDGKVVGTYKLLDRFRVIDVLNSLVLDFNELKQLVNRA